MKVTAFLPVAFAFTAVAELQLYSFPTPVKRDAAAVSSVAVQIADAITKLDTSVKAFQNDATQVQSDAENLANTIKEGAKTIVSSGVVSLPDLIGLQDVISPLVTASESLLSDLKRKKAAFEAAGLCDTVESVFKSISSEVQGLVGGIAKTLPQEAQDVISQLLKDVTGKLTKCGDIFGKLHCKNHGTSTSVIETTSTYTGGFYSTAISVTSESTTVETTTAETTTAETTIVETTTAESTTTEVTTTEVVTSVSATSIPELSTPGITQIAITVTVTAPCVCDTTTSTSSVSIPLLTPGGGGAPYPTGSNSTTTFFPTGSFTTTALPAGIPTGGAGSNGVGAVGLMAGLAAALFV